MRDSNISKESVAEGIDDLDAKRVETLRQILESEQGRPVTSEEAQEVGRSLLKLFEALADGVEPLASESQEDITQPTPVPQQPQQLLLV
jgi:urease accessory protein UreF